MRQQNLYFGSECLTKMRHWNCISFIHWPTLTFTHKKMRVLFFAKTEKKYMYAPNCRRCRRMGST